MDAQSTAIRTPDQRLRVFVSSTLKELAAERKAARSAVERLALAPGVFELGARPHPPRDLYRAYLEQSDIFVGLYWERYGWVAPDETVSGLEDEYNLAPATMPRLIYIKEASGEREPRLAELLERIRRDDRASFKYFTDAQELAELLVTDLALLLAERFERGLEPAPTEAPAEPSSVAARGRLPASVTALIGRDREVAEVGAMLAQDSTRLVTLVGPGGIGKTRLAMEVAAHVGEDYLEGVFFVPLAPVAQADLVVSAIAQTLGVRDEGDVPLLDKLAIALRHAHRLLVLDNFEHVLDAAPLLAQILAAAPNLKLLVTSRVLLRLSAEHSYGVGPLGLPHLAGGATRLGGVSDSVRLFVDRARAVKPDFELTSGNTDAVERICLTLEGVPLAIELAAAKIRLLTPSTLLDRLTRQLAVLVGGQRDLPPRQRTLRSTIEWSVQLLGEDAKRLLAHLAVFAGRFSLDAAEFLWDESGSGDVLDLLGNLVDSSLVRQHDHQSRPYFSMLSTVREYGLEQLQASGEVEPVQDRHALYYVGLATRAEAELQGGEGLVNCVDRLTQEQDNLRAALRHLLDRQEWDVAADLVWRLYIYWWLAGLFGEVGDRMEELLRHRSLLHGRALAIALFAVGGITLFRRSGEESIAMINESADLFQREGDPSAEGLVLMGLALGLLRGGGHAPGFQGPETQAQRAEEALHRSAALFRQVGNEQFEAMSLIQLGGIALLRNDIARSEELYNYSLAISRRRNDEFVLGVALYSLGWSSLSKGATESARARFGEAMGISLRIGHVEGIALALEGFVGLAAVGGDTASAGRLLGAAEMTRERVGASPNVVAPHWLFLDPMLKAGDDGTFERERAAGRHMDTTDAVEFALSVGAPAAEPEAVPSTTALP
jgi:predicted ATPase